MERSSEPQYHVQCGHGLVFLRECEYLNANIYTFPLGKCTGCSYITILLWAPHSLGCFDMLTSLLWGHINKKHYPASSRVNLAGMCALYCCILKLM